MYYTQYHAGLDLISENKVLNLCGNIYVVPALCGPFFMSHLYSQLPGKEGASLLILRASSLSRARGKLFTPWPRPHQCKIEMKMLVLSTPLGLSQH